MRSCVSLAILLPLCLIPASAQTLKATWGLQNNWSYFETTRAENQDGANRPPPKGESLRTFAFDEHRPEVLEPMLKCFERHDQLWRQWQALKSKPPQGGVSIADPERAAFEAYKAKNDPFCDQQVKKQAPVLYFDFVADSPDDEYVLDRIEVATLGFSEYAGGGFAQQEAWYDIVLSHHLGRKVYSVERKLVFKGHGRAQLRFWSDNFYPGHGWIAPMGEYLIDVQFVFMVRGRTVTIATSPFKIDV